MKMTEQEISRAINRQGSNMESAIRRYQQDKAELYRSDGNPKYADDIMREREAALLAQLDEAKAEALAGINEAVAGVDDLIAQVAYPDITDGLSLIEIDKLNAKRPFIKENVEELPYAQLAMAIRAALARGEETEIKLYQRYAGRKLELDRHNEMAVQMDGFFDFLKAAESLPSNTVDTSTLEELRKTAQKTDMEIRKMHSDATGATERAREAQAEFTKSIF